MAIQIVGPPSKRCTTCHLSKCISKFCKKSGNRIRSICKECKNLENKRYRDNSIKQQESIKLYYLRTKAKRALRDRRSQRREYYLRTRDQRISKQLAHAKKNPAMYAAQSMYRLLKTKKATPSWFCKEKVLEKYQLAAKNSAETGIKWHVDHVVPLVSNLVCGLHVEANLEVIPASENIAKGNRYWPDMP